jgi:hypothetical protein
LEEALHLMIHILKNVVTHLENAEPEIILSAEIQQFIDM